MTVTFYSGFSKRINSTKQPAITGTDHDCKLKEDCSEHDPVLLLQSTAQYDYAYISAWAKFYYVKDIVSKSNTISEYHLSEDVMGTYKYYIGNTYAQIAYSSTDYDSLIIDPRIQVSSKKTVKTLASSGTAVFGASPGWYLLSVFADSIISGVNNGFAVTYILSDSGMEKLRRWLSDTNVWQAVFNYFKGEPIRSIFRCIHVPYNVPNASITGVSSCVIGNQSSGAIFTTGECGIISGFPIDYQYHALAFSRTYTDFRRSEPYTTAQIHLPGIGLVDLCMGDFGGASGCTVSVAIEILTGNVQYNIAVGGEVIYTASTNVAAQCPIGTDIVDSGGVMNGITTFIGGAVSLVGAMMTEGATAALSAGAMVAGAANTALAANRHAQMISGNIGGRMASLGVYIYMNEYTVETQDPNDVNYIANRGRPCKKTALISSLGGYTECVNASVSCPGQAEEKEEINRYLNTGFFYE